MLKFKDSSGKVVARLSDEMSEPEVFELTPLSEVDLPKEEDLEGEEDVNS